MSKRKEHTVVVHRHATRNGVGRTLPTLRTRMCFICLGKLEETTEPVGQRCPNCRLWARKNHVWFGVRF